MIRFDFHIAIVMWVLSLFTVPLGLIAVAIIAATTVNLWHQRRTMFNAGMEFERRVILVLSEMIDDYESRMKLVEANVADIKESQVKIAGAFRGRQLP